MSEKPPRDEAAPEVQAPPHADPHPRGTMFLMMLFLITIVAMWGFVYMILLARG